MTESPDEMIFDRTAQAILKPVSSSVIALQCQEGQRLWKLNLKIVTKKIAYFICLHFEGL